MKWRRRVPPGRNGKTSVAMVDDALSATGSVRWAVALAEEWAALGMSVRHLVLLDRQDTHLAAPAMGVPLTYGARHGARLRRALPRALPKVIREISQANVTLVISEIGVSLPVCYFVSRLARRPIVVIVQSIIEHSMTAWVPRRLLPVWHHCLRHADAVVCVSTGSADSVRRLGVPPERVSVIYSGIDADDVARKSEATPTVVVGDDPPVLVSSGELVAAKGHDLLLRALAAVRRQGYRARLVILGEGPERSSLEKLAAELGIADSVFLPGFKANPYPEVRAAQLFCLASRFEGFPLCLLEAMAIGVPIVATDADGGGTRELLEDGRFGALVAPNSVEELADAIVRHLRHPEELRSRAADGCVHVQQFTPATLAAAYQDIFCRVTKRDPGVSGTVARLIRMCR